MTPAGKWERVDGLNGVVRVKAPRSAECVNSNIDVIMMNADDTTVITIEKYPCFVHRDSGFLQSLEELVARMPVA